MSPAAEEYAELELKLLVGRMLGTLAEQREDELLEEMDRVWWQMSAADREWAERRARGRASVEAPASLDLRDCVVSEGEHQLPRQAA